MGARLHGVRAACLWFALVGLGSVNAWSADTLHITADWPSPENGIMLWDYWCFKAGDDSTWAAAELPDHDWQTLDAYTGDAPGGWSWRGAGWFRVHLRVDSALFNQMLALAVYQRGASEIYLNGHRVAKLGEVGASEDTETPVMRFYAPPIRLQLAAEPHQVLAIRYSAWVRTPFWDRVMDRGLGVELRDWEATEKLYLSFFAYGLRHQTLAAGVSLTFFIIHLFTYLFYRRYRANLYFALFTASAALLTFAPAQMSVTHAYGAFETWHVLFKISVLTTSIFGMWFLSVLFFDRALRSVKVLAGVTAAAVPVAYFIPRSLIYVLALAALAEMTRLLVVAFLRRKQGSRLIGFGYLTFALACTFQMLQELGWFPRLPSPYEGFVYMYGLLVLLFTMSVYLARQFAYINTDLHLRLEQVEELSARAIEQERHAREQETNRKLLEQEIEHKKKELEEAQKLARALADLEEAHRHLKKTQTQLAQSEKMASLGMLVAGVAHEINTPVGAISSMQGTLDSALQKLTAAIEAGCSETCNVGDRAARALQAMEEANRVMASASERVTNIVRRLRSFARLDEAELKRTQINEGLEDTLTLMHHELKHHIEVVRDYGELPPIPCFAAQLNQVFLNLLVNARQAISGRGTIRVRTWADRTDVYVEIQDSGKGIPPENLGRIFDPGFTTKGVGVGTGLGLSICYQIVETHQGEIRVDSEVGKGTTFTIRLPRDLDVRLGTKDT